jgi:long-chain fatty acid transport protein
VQDGSAIFITPSAVADLFPSTTFNTGLALPGVLNAGLSYRLNEKLILSFDVNYIQWSAYDSLIIDFKDNTERLSDLRSARLYKNSLILRWGAQYQLNEKLILRGGFYLDQSPVQSGYLTPETPDSDKLGLTFGLSYSIGSRLSLDAALLYTEGKKRSDTNLETEFEAVYKSKAVIPCLGLSWNF